MSAEARPRGSDPDKTSATARRWASAALAAARYVNGATARADAALAAGLAACAVAAPAGARLGAPAAQAATASPAAAASPLPAQRDAHAGCPPAIGSGSWNAVCPPAAPAAAARRAVCRVRGHARDGLEVAGNRRARDAVASHVGSRAGPRLPLARRAHGDAPAQRGQDRGAEHRRPELAEPADALGGLGLGGAFNLDRHQRGVGELAERERVGTVVGRLRLDDDVPRVPAQLAG